MDDKQIVLYVRDDSGNLHKLLETQCARLTGVPGVQEAIEKISTLTMSCQLEMSQACYDALMQKCKMFYKLQDFEKNLDKIPEDYIYIEPLKYHEQQSAGVCKPKYWKYNKRRNFKSRAYWKRIRSRTW